VSATAVETNFGVLRQHVPAGAQRQIEPVEAGALRRLGGLGDREIGQVIGEEDELHAVLKRREKQ